MRSEEIQIDNAELKEEEQIMTGKANRKVPNVSRRHFLKTSAATGVAAALAGVPKMFARGSDKLRVGLVGCGQRGTGAAKNCVHAAENVEIVAMGDLFEDRLQESFKSLKNNETIKSDWYSSIPWQCADKAKVTEETCFVGFDAYKKVIACDVDMVILATPPHYRPMHLAAAVEANKHVFIEKPVAVDPVGVRSVIASSELAAKKGLSIVAGTHCRRHAPYLEIMKRIHNGQIGEIVAGQCYFNWGKGLDWKYPRQTGWSDMQWQCRNWYYFTWLSGDHIVEQHVHNIDAINWAIGANPVKAMGMGGREVRTDAVYGNIFDHFAVEFEYPNGVRVLSMCSQIEGTTVRTSEHLVGTKGTTCTDKGVGRIEGKNPYEYDGPSSNPYVQEHTDLINSIRTSELLNEGRQIAESTLAAIMGRMSAYTGREISWKWVMNGSKLDLSPPRYDFGDWPLPVRPVPVPGKTRLV